MFKTYFLSCHVLLFQEDACYINIKVDDCHLLISYLEKERPRNT